MQGIVIEQFEGTIYEHGYGTVPKKIMQDKKISVGGINITILECKYGENQGY